MAGANPADFQVQVRQLSQAHPLPRGLFAEWPAHEAVERVFAELGGPYAFVWGTVG